MLLYSKKLEAKTEHGQKGALTLEQRKTVVVADDEPIIRLDVCQMLEELGFVVAGQAADGFDAVECCRAHHPELLLLDIKMPVFDGLSAAKQVTEEGLAGTVVLLTAYLDDDLMSRALEAGVTGYLVKPVEQRMLLPTLQVAMAQSQRLSKARSQAKAAQAQLEQGKLVERAKILLAAREKITEAEAYRTLQKLAMDKGRPIHAVAELIVSQCDPRAQLQREKERLMERKGLSEAAAFRQISQRARREKISLEEAARALLKEEPDEGIL